MYFVDMERPSEHLGQSSPDLDTLRGSTSAALIDHLCGREASPPTGPLDEVSSVFSMSTCAAAAVGSILAGSSPEPWLDALETHHAEAFDDTLPNARVAVVGAASALYRGDEQTAQALLDQLPPSVSGLYDEFFGLLDVWSRRDIDWDDESEQLHLLFTAMQIAGWLGGGGISFLLMAAGALGDEEFRRRLHGAVHVLDERWPKPSLEIESWHGWDVRERVLTRRIEVVGRGRLALWEPLVGDLLYKFYSTLGRPLSGQIGTPAYKKLTKRRLVRMYADERFGIEFNCRLGEDVELDAGFAATDRLFRTAVIHGAPRLEHWAREEGLQRLRGPVRFVVTRGDELLHELEVMAPETQEDPQEAP